MYKRFLAGLVALTVVFTSVPYPDTVQASQVSKEVAIEDTEEHDVAEEIELLEELESALEGTEDAEEGETVDDVENAESVENAEEVETTENTTESSEVVEEQMPQTEKVESTEVEVVHTEKVDTETKEDVEVEESTEEATTEVGTTEKIEEETETVEAKEESEETEGVEEIDEVTEETEEIEETEKVEETESTELKETALENEISVKGTNSFGNLLASELTEVSEEQEENNGYNVFSIEMVDSSAIVSFETVEDCTLVVGVYDEAGAKMLAAGSLEVYQGETSAVVDIETDSMPQYFYLRGFLVDTDTFRPLCTSYESPMYTQEMQEFLAKTTADFDEEKVLNLDDDTTNNFAVYSDETVIVEEVEGSNEVVTADEETSTYVFENADESITSLQVGDIFAYERTDGEVIIIKVGSIVIDGTTATIIGIDTSMEEVFEYVKIDTDAGTADAEIDASTCDEGVTYEGLVDYTEDGETQTYAVDEELTSSKALSVSLEKSLNDNVKVSGGVELKLENTLKVYISLSYQYLELKTDYSAKANIAVTGKAEIPLLKLPSVKFMPVTGIIVEFNPAFVIEVSGKLDISAKLTGTVGFSVDSDTGCKDLTSGVKAKAEIKGEATVFLGFSFEIEAKIIDDDIASAKASFQAGKEWKGKLVFYSTASSSKVHACKQCVDGDIANKVESKFEVKFIKLIKFTYKKEWSKKIGDFYYSYDYDEYGESECPHYYFKTEVKVIDNNGEKINGARVSASFYENGFGQNETVTSAGDLVATDHITAGTDGKAVGYLVPGKHTLTVTKDGYETVTKKITVTDDEKDVVVRLEPKVIRVKEISLGFLHSAAITEDGSLYMWGGNSYGQLGNGTTQDCYLPTKIMENISYVSLGYEHSAAITEDGSLYVWGRNYHGELGNGTEKDSFIPLKIMDNVKQISLGFYCSAAVTEDGSLYMWGSNAYGKLGNGVGEGSSNIPIKIMDNVEQVALGENHSGVIKKDGSLYMWGRNWYGELGNGIGEYDEQSWVPIKIMDGVKYISLGAEHSAAITEDGSLYMWGCDGHGQLGNGTEVGHCNIPLKIMDNVVRVELGMWNSGAITENGSLYTWGYNWKGGLGNGTELECNVPVKVMNNVKQFDLAFAHSGATTEDKSLYMWGYNSRGQLGNSAQLGISEIEGSKIPIPITIPSETTTLRSEDTLYATATSEFSTLKAATITNNENSTTQTASFTDLLPNELYNFYIMKSKSGENLLGSDNLLYIGQSTSDASGAMNIVFEAKESYDDAEVFVVGITRSNISGASVKVPNLEYDGTERYVTPQVTLNGVQLVEGKDYELTSGYSASKVGTYTVTLTGIGLYTGTVTASYQMVCTHTYGGNWTITKAATCTSEGSKYRTCTKCGAKSAATVIPKTAHTYGSTWITEKKATCTADGSKYQKCTKCNAKGNVTVIKKTGHTYKDVKVTKKATTKKNGTVNQKCSACGKTRTVTIYAAKTAKLSTTSYTYNGKARKPSVTVTDSKGNKLKNKTDYTVSYAKGRKNVGKYTVTIKLKGKYSGIIKKTFTIKPKTTSISNLSAAKKGFTVKWKKQKSQTTGYEIQYSTSSKFTKKTTKTVKITKNSTTSKKITKLKAKKKYYVRVRTYKTVKVDGKPTKIYSDWSKDKKVTTKK